jgi:hypothetical protein
LREQEILQLLNIIQRLSAHLAPELDAAIEAEAVSDKTWMTLLIAGPCSSPAFKQTGRPRS